MSRTYHEQKRQRKIMAIVPKKHDLIPSECLNNTCLYCKGNKTYAVRKQILASLEQLKGWG